MAIGLSPGRAAKASRLLTRLRSEGATDKLKPLLEAGEVLLEQFVGDVVATAGECGPVSRAIMHTAAWQKSMSVLYADAAAAETDPKEAIRMVRLAADLGDRSRANTLAAQALAVQIARTRPMLPGDPLAAYDVPAEPEG